MTCVRIYHVLCESIMFSLKNHPGVLLPGGERVIRCLHISIPIFHCNAKPQTREFLVGDTNMFVSKKPTQGLAHPTRGLAHPTQDLVNPALASGIWVALGTEGLGLCCLFHLFLVGYRG